MSSEFPEASSDYDGEKIGCGYVPYDISRPNTAPNPYYASPDSDWTNTPKPNPIGLMELPTIGQTYIIPFFPKGSNDENDCRQIFDCESPRRYPKLSSSASTFSRNLLSDCPEYFHLRLPKVYDPSSYFSNRTIMLVFECLSDTQPSTVVFAFDPYQSELYHIVTKKETKRYPFGWGDGFAAFDDYFYFVGGCYRNHDAQQSYQDAFDDIVCDVELMTLNDVCNKATVMADANITNNLEVEAFHLGQCKWEDDKTCITKFHKPKHKPFVFTFQSKIYALAVKKSTWELGDRFPSFESLDTLGTSSGSPKEEKSNGSPTTWSILPSPPFIAMRDSRCILCNEKNCLFVKISDNDVEGNIQLLWKFDLVSEKWFSNTTDPSSPFYDPEDSDFLNSLTQVPLKHFEGCIVHNILFHFEDNIISGKSRLLVGHDLRGKKVIMRRWEIDLKNLLHAEGHRTLSRVRLSHLEYFDFCLVINYAPCYGLNVNFLCLCVFELSLSDPVSEDLHFIPTLLKRLYFQLPNSLLLTYHTKLSQHWPYE